MPERFEPLRARMQQRDRAPLIASPLLNARTKRRSERIETTKKQERKKRNDACSLTLASLLYREDRPSSGARVRALSRKQSPARRADDAGVSLAIQVTTRRRPVFSYCHRLKDALCQCSVSTSWSTCRRRHHHDNRFRENIMFLLAPV